MGLLATLTGPFAEPLAEHFQDVPTVAIVCVGVFGLLCFTVLATVLRQVLVKNPNEPPIVFHWFPVIGNTITYGMDPMSFFQRCHEKVTFP
jgi:sterol 14-demethylase